MQRLHGVVPALVTPLDADERFLPDSFERLLERVYSAGAHGVYVCGQTGEGLLQSVAQRKLVAEAAVRNSPAGSQVIVHTGAFTTADAVELSRHAWQIGATAVSSLPPLGRYGFAEIREYYRTIGSSIEVPLLVYYFPEVCDSIRTADQILELCALPNVAGLKYTDFNLYMLANIRATGAVIFNGRDEVFAAGMLMGADGGIGTFYNVVPELFVEVYECARAGRWDDALSAQKRINRLIEVTLRYPVFPAVKRLLDWSGIPCGPCIRPRAGLTPDQEREYRAALEAEGLLELVTGKSAPS